MMGAAAELEATFAAAPDAGFRGRVLSEYRTVRHWVKDRVDWDHARILDFGCGDGIAAASVALRHPMSRVEGFDILPVDTAGLARLFDRQTGQTLPPNLDFLSAFAEQTLDKAGDAAGYDLIYSWSVFEHIRQDQIVPACRAIKSALQPGGFFFLQIDPLYFSPRGSHLYRFFKEPWHHLTLSLDELREITCDPAHGEVGTREWQQFVELNRLTGRQIIDRAKAAGLHLLREQFFSTETEPPASLLDIYKADTLTTVGLYALFSRG
jgi:SAM-dependent methyltransferase